IKREYSNAKTPQQNRVAERKNMTLIEAARTMLADSFLPNTFWAEAVSTVEMDIRQKDEKSSKNGQNRAWNGKAWKSQSQIKAKVNKVKVNPKKSTVKTRADTEEYLMGLPEPI
ncbi:putative ribonuclease H-like domain-containing protein, partial [Tanacetum coccineum]